MAVRFIIGRAGSGKTHHCLHAIRQRIQEDPLEGPRLLLLVPEQASLQMERAILEPVEGEQSAAAHRAEVLSFRRLAHRVVDSIPGLKPITITEQARNMVLRHILNGLGDRLIYYRRPSRSDSGRSQSGGLVQRIADTLVEFMQESVSPSDLLPLGQAREEAETGILQDAAQAKLHDLGMIHHAYMDYLGTEKLDPAHDLQFARAHMGKCDWLNDVELWVDGFASFSMQELMTLEELAASARDTSITMMIDPSQLDKAGNQTDWSDSNTRLFSRTLKTYHDMNRRFKRIGLDLAPTILLDQEKQQRFPRDSVLEAVERNFYAEKVAPMTPGSSNVELVELPSRRLEVDYGVHRICEWIQNKQKAYRFRDLAIIVRNLESYHTLLADALTARGIPFFMDRRKTTGHHPLVEWIRAAMAVLTESFSVESIRRVLKTRLIGLGDRASDALENYLIAHGIAGFEAWSSGDWQYNVRSGSRGDTGRRQELSLQRINESRKQFLLAMNLWMTGELRRGSASGTDWVDTTLQWIATLGVAERLEHWIQSSEEEGDLDQADEHRQVWREVHSFLDDARFALGDAQLSVAEWADVLDAGLTGLTLGLVPPTVDQVLVGSIERSRHPAIKAALIIGFNEGEFPQRITEDSILNDDDRAWLESKGVGLRPPAKERVQDEAMLAYVALTRPSEHLVVTFAALDADQKQLRPSPYILELQRACSELKVKKQVEPWSSNQWWDVQTRGDLAQRLAFEFRNLNSKKESDSVRAAVRDMLYDTTRRELSADRVLQWALRSLHTEKEERVAHATMTRLHPGAMQSSVSRLESFAKCPFKHFAEYSLGLKEREESVLQSSDVGTLHHAILEDYISKITGSPTTYASLDPGGLRKQLNQSLTRTDADLAREGKWSDARTKYRMRQSVGDLERVVKAQIDRSGATEMVPWAVELRFGFEDSGIAPLEYRTKRGDQVRLRGVIDRVDILKQDEEDLAIVVDYKSAREKKLKADEVYYGTSLQLLTYALVLEENGRHSGDRPLRPIGAFYVSLAPRYAKADHPDSVRERDLLPIGSSRPRGLIHGDYVDALEPDAGDKWSLNYSIYRKTNGELGNRNKIDAADGASFSAMLAHTRRMLTELADGVFEGCVDVYPVRHGSVSPCQWCRMLPVCRFENGLNTPNYLESIDQTEVWDRLRNQQA